MMKERAAMNPKKEKEKLEGGHGANSVNFL